MKNREKFHSCPTCKSIYTELIWYPLYKCRDCYKIFKTKVLKPIYHKLKNWI